MTLRRGGKIFADLQKQQDDLINRFKIGDLVTPYFAPAWDFYGTVVDINTKEWKVYVDFNGTISQFDPSDIRVILKQEVKNKFGSRGRKAIYWGKSPRKYRVTQDESESNEYRCPKCKTAMDNDGYSRRVALLACPSCGFKITTDYVLQSKLKKLAANVANQIMAFDFPTEEAMKKYLEEHPDADKSLHHVKKEEGDKKPKETKKTEPSEPDYSDPDMGETIDLDAYDESKVKEKVQETKKFKHKKMNIKSDSMNSVNEILDKHKIDKEEDAMHELAGFKNRIRNNQQLSKETVKQKKEQGEKFWPRNAEKLKKAFIENMDSSNYSSSDAFKSAQERMRKVPPEDFAKILAAIEEDDEA